MASLNSIRRWLGAAPEKNVGGKKHVATMRRSPVIHNGQTLRPLPTFAEYSIANDLPWLGLSYSSQWLCVTISQCFLLPVAIAAPKKNGGGGSKATKTHNETTTAAGTDGGMSRMAQRIWATLATPLHGAPGSAQTYITLVQRSVTSPPPATLQPAILLPGTERHLSVALLTKCSFLLIQSIVVCHLLN